MIFLLYSGNDHLREAIKEAAIHDPRLDPYYGVPKALLPLNEKKCSLDLLLERLSVLKDDIRIIANARTFLLNSNRLRFKHYERWSFSSGLKNILSIGSSSSSLFDKLRLCLRFVKNEEDPIIVVPTDLWHKQEGLGAFLSANQGSLVLDDQESPILKFKNKKSLEEVTLDDDSLSLFLNEHQNDPPSEWFNISSFNDQDFIIFPF
jgi:hypothetical protein